MTQLPSASFAGRWALVEARLREEAAADDETKLVQLDSLMASVDDFGWRAELEAEDERVRQLWCRLRSAAGSPHGAPRGG